MQVDPIKPKLKPPYTHRLKPKADELLSNFAFKFNLRRYTVGAAGAGAAAAVELVEAYVEQLFSQGRYAPAVSLVLHFSLERFASAEFLQALATAREFGLASDMALAASGASSGLRAMLVEACMATEEHAGYRAAWNAVEKFDLHAGFPLVKQRYFESTIGRMIEKGSPEVALRHAGDDPGLQAAVVQHLVGDVSLVPYGRLVIAWCLDCHSLTVSLGVMWFWWSGV